MRAAVLVVLMLGCAEPVDEPPQRRDAGSRPFIPIASDGGSVDAGLRPPVRDGGSDAGAEEFDAGLIIDEPFDDGGVASDGGCSCTFKIDRPDHGGVFLSTLTLFCGASVCSESGALDFGCDAQGVPRLPDCPMPHPCVCTVTTGRRLRCGTSVCGGPISARTSYACSATGQLSGPMTCL